MVMFGKKKILANRIDLTKLISEYFPPMQVQTVISQVRRKWCEDLNADETETVEG